MIVAGDFRMVARDIVGQELTIGDVVVMTMPRYADICFATIIAFTPKNVRVQYKNDTKLAHSKTLFKVDKSLLVEYLLKNNGTLP